MNTIEIELPNWIKFSKKIKELKEGKTLYVSYNEFLKIQEFNQQNNEFIDTLLFLDLESKKYTLKPTEKHFIPISKNKKGFILNLPYEDSSINNVFNKEYDYKKKINKLISRILNNIKKENIIKLNQVLSEKEKESNDEKIKKLLNKEKYQKIWGRDLTAEEKSYELQNVSMEDFKPKKPKINKKEIEKIFSKVHLDQDIKEKIFRYCGINELLKGKKPKKENRGIILIGPPRTGKSELLECLKKTFMKLSEVEKEEEIILEIPPLRAYVGEGTRKGKEFFTIAKQKAKKNKSYSLLFLDESIKVIMDKGILDKTEGGFYKDLSESLKAHIGNKSGEGVITVFAANPYNKNNKSEQECRNELDNALAEDGRLQVLFIGLPDIINSKKIFEDSIRKNINLKKKITDKQLEKLARIAVRFEANGGNIHYFCTGFYEETNLEEKMPVEFEVIESQFEKYMLARKGEKGFSYDEILENILRNEIRILDGVSIHSQTINSNLNINQEIQIWITNLRDQLIMSKEERNKKTDLFRLAVGIIKGFITYINQNFDSNQNLKIKNNLKLKEIFNKLLINAKGKIHQASDIYSFIENEFSIFFETNKQDLTQIKTKLLQELEQLNRGNINPNLYDNLIETFSYYLNEVKLNEQWDNVLENIIANINSWKENKEFNLDKQRINLIRNFINKLLEI